MSESVGTVSSPHKGIQVWKAPTGITVFRLHYLADPEKTVEWAAAQKAAMTDPEMYEQEYEISFTARLGTLIYQLHDEATLESSFPIPADWTRYWALDPHPRTPHAMLWGAVDHWGDFWIYREFWPSKVCLRYEDGKLLGERGPQPEGDNRFRVREYIEAVRWLESRDGNLHLKADEKIFKRVIDYAARGIKGTTDDSDQRNLQQRYEEESLSLDYPLTFEDAIKDVGTGVEVVNDWLKAREVEHRGGFRPYSKLHIFQDRCPELIHQLKSQRYQQLTPGMVEKKDPTEKAIEARSHLNDCLRYLCMANPVYIGPRTKGHSTWKPIHEGVAY